MSSEESYDPEDDRKKKRDKSRKKAKRKWLEKRKRAGPAERTREVAIKQKRRSRGEINRHAELRLQ